MKIKFSPISISIVVFFLLACSNELKEKNEATSFDQYNIRVSMGNKSIIYFHLNNQNDSMEIIKFDGDSLMLKKINSSYLKRESSKILDGGGSVYFSIYNNNSLLSFNFNDVNNLKDVSENFENYINGLKGKYNIINEVFRPKK